MEESVKIDQTSIPKYAQTVAIYQRSLTMEVDKCCYVAPKQNMFINHKGHKEGTKVTKGLDRDER